MTNYYSNYSSYLNSKLCCESKPLQIVGPTGLNGPSGKYGLTGINTVTGISNINTGNSGYTGYIGHRGSDGYDKFITGPTGFTGVKGVGFIGPNGKEGPTGVSSQGFTGSIGSTGQARDGYIGPTGVGSEYGYTGFQGQNMTGTTGNKGITGITSSLRGETGYTGSKYIGGPTGPINLSNLVGPSGVTGNNNIIGPTGSSFTNSKTGNTGPEGSSGITGLTNGPTGVLGITGNTYLIVNSLTGNTGSENVIGSTGLQGPSLLGPTGAEISSLLKYPNSVYVSANASSNGTGSFENPFKTIQDAIDYCEDSNIENYSVIIYDGTYTENITITKSCYIGSFFKDVTRNVYYNTYLEISNITINGTITINADDENNCDVFLYGIINKLPLTITTTTTNKNVNIHIIQCSFTPTDSANSIILCTSSLEENYLVKIIAHNSVFSKQVSFENNNIYTSDEFAIDLMYDGGNSRTCLYAYNCYFISRNCGWRIGCSLNIESSSIAFTDVCENNNAGVYERFPINIYRTDNNTNDENMVSLKNNNFTLFNANGKDNISIGLYIITLKSGAMSGINIELLFNIFNISLSNSPSFINSWLFKNETNNLVYIKGSNNAFSATNFNFTLNDPPTSNSYFTPTGGATQVTITEI